MCHFNKTLTEELAFHHVKSILLCLVTGANIFLVSDGKLKLGDFGCSAKLKGAATMPGEMVAFVGTAGNVLTSMCES